MMELMEFFIQRVQDTGEYQLVGPGSAQPGDYHSGNEIQAGGHGDHGMLVQIVAASITFVELLCLKVMHTKLWFKLGCAIDGCICIGWPHSK